MTNLQAFIEQQKERISKLPKSKQEKATVDLRDWVKSYITARQLRYSKETLTKILNARNSIHASNILVDARRAS